MGKLLNKKSNLIIAIAVVCVLLLTAVCGVLFISAPSSNNAQSSMTAPSADRKEVPIVWGDDVGRVPEGYVPEGTPISDQTGLDAFIEANAAAGSTGKCYLTKDIDYTIVGAGGGNVGDPSTCYGTIDGNGHTINLVGTAGTSGSWADPNMQALDGIEAMGLFMGINYATIQNVTFIYSGTFQIGYNSQKWAAGIICGRNLGTINNVRLDINGVLACHFDNGQGGYNRISLGGICGVNSATITNSHVNMSANSKLEANAKVKKPSWTWEENRTMASVGGVIGSTTTGHTTYNLSIIGDSTSSLTSKCTVDGTGTGKANYARFVGAIVGFSAKGMTGLFGNFQGAFEANGGPHYFDYDKYIAGGGKADNADKIYCGALAYCDAPANYYNQKEYITLNGFESKGDFITMGNWDPFNDYANVVKTNKNTITTDGDALPAMVMNFDQAKVGEIILSGDLNSNADKELIYWNVSAIGKWDGKYNPIQTKICDYTNIEGKNNRKSLSIALSLEYEFNVQIDMGHSYKSFTEYKNNFGGLYDTNTDTFKMPYTGEDLRNVFGSRALNAIGRSDIAYVEDDIIFDVDGTALDPFITPARYENVKVKASNKTGFSYFNSDLRVCVDPTTINMEVTKTRINAVGDLSSWAQSHQIDVSVPNQVAALDRVDYKIVGADNYTTIEGNSFSYALDTPFSGVTLEILGYKNGDAVTEIYTTGVVKVDTVAPESDFDPAILTPEIWRNDNIDYTFNAMDELSGLSMVKVKSAVLHNSNTEGTNTKAITYSYSDNSTHTITIIDMAGNQTTIQVAPHIDTTAPTVTSVDFFTMDGNAEVPYVSGTGVKKTVYVRANYTLGPSGGFMYLIDEASVDHEFSPVVLEPNSTVSTPFAITEETDGLSLSVLIRSAALDKDEANPKEVTYDPNVTVIIGRNPVLVTKESLAFSQTSKVYDGTDVLNEAFITVYSDVTGGVIEAENANITKTATFSQKNAGEGLTLTVSLTNKEGFNNKFVYKEGDKNVEYAGGTPVFTYTEEDLATEIKIDKKDATVRVNSATKVYGNDNPEFTASVEGLVAGDEDAITYSLSCEATKESVPNAEGYAIVADDTAVFENYNVTYVNAVLTISRRTITELTVTPFDPDDPANEGKDPYQTNFNNLFTFSFVATFVDPFGEKQNYTITYYKDGAEFVYGFDNVTWGRYTYVCQMPAELQDRYVDGVSSGFKEGFFTIVSDKVYSGVDFAVAGDEDNDHNIKLEFTNQVVNFMDLVTFNNKEIGHMFSIKFGEAEYSTPEEAYGEIKAIGTYLITMVLEANDRYTADSFVYTLEITKANVDFELESISKVFDNNAASIVMPAAAMEKLNSLGVTPDQIKFMDIDKEGNATPHIGQTNAGEYKVQLTIENPNINSISKTAKITIEKATVTITMADVEKAYDGKAAELALSAADKATLEALGVDIENDVTFSLNDLIDAGKYKVTATVSNKNINSVSAKFNVTINATKITDVFAFEVKEGIIYDGTVKNIKLVNEYDEKGYDIKYLNEDGFVNAGVYKVKAVISKFNYETTSVEGELVIGKANLQSIVDGLGISLDSASKEYDGTPISVELSAATQEVLNTNGISFSYGGDGNRQIKTGNYNVEVRLSKPNYETAVVYGYITIDPKPVKINFVFNEQDYVDKLILKAGDEISISASYTDIKGEVVPVETLSFVQVIKGKKGEEDSYEDFEMEDDAIPDGEYAFVAEIDDENYVIEEGTEMAFFQIKSPTPVVPIAVGAGVGGTAVVGGGIAAAVLLVLKKKKLG